jgi:hypothetical protein
MGKLLKSLAALFIFFATACEKEPTFNDSPSRPKSRGSIGHFPLKTGNWWAYNYHTVSSNGTVVQKGIDTIYIAKDTIINAKKYFNRTGRMFGQPFNDYLRDSLHYLVNHHGTILYSATNFKDTLFMQQQGPGNYQYSMMAHKDTLIQAEAGTYKASAYTHNFTGPDYNFTCYDFFSSYIGIVKMHHYTSAGTQIIKELKVYQLK